MACRFANVGRAFKIFPSELQAGMEMLSLPQLKSYLWVYWCLADTASGKSTARTKRERRKKTPAGGTGGGMPDSLTHKLREVLQAKSDEQQTLRKLRQLLEDERDQAHSPDTEAVFSALLEKVDFPEGASPSGRRGTSGFQRSNVALWFRAGTDEIADHLGDSLDNPRIAFAEGKTFAKKVLDFVGTERFDEWRIGALNLRKVLSRDQKAFLDSLEGLTLPIPFLGSVLIGPDPDVDGVTWIGIRSSERHARLKAKLRGRLLSISPRRVEESQPVALTRWAVSARVPEFLNDPATDVVAVLHAVAAEAVAVHEAGEVDRVVVASSRTSDASPDLSGASTEALLVLSDTPMHRLEELVLEAMPREGPKLYLADRERLLGFISRFPWIWSARTTAQTFRVFDHRDTEVLCNSLRKAYDFNPLPLHAADALVHPSVLSIAADTRLVAITGGVGAGKTIAAYHFASRRAKGAVLVLLNIPSETDREVIFRMVENDAGAVVVIDDLHEYVQSESVAALLRQLADHAACKVVVSYPEPEADVMRSVLDNPLRRFTEVNIDNATQFLQNVSVEFRRHLGLKSPDPASDVEWASHVHPTLRTVLQYQWQRRDGYMVPEKDPIVLRYWYGKFQTLLRTSPETIAALQTAAALRNFGRYPLVSEVHDVGEFLGISRPSVTIALQRLARDGWLAIDDDVVVTDEVRFDGVVTGLLLADGTPSMFLRQFVTAVLRNPATMLLSRVDLITRMRFFREHILTVGEFIAEWLLEDDISDHAATLAVWHLGYPFVDIVRFHRWLILYLRERPPADLFEGTFTEMGVNGVPAFSEPMVRWMRWRMADMQQRIDTLELSKADSLVAQRLLELKDLLEKNGRIA